MLSWSSGPAAPPRRVGGGEDRGQDREVLGDVVGDRERGQRAARDQQLLADLDDLDQLGRVGVEVDHVARLARRLGAGVHGHADVGLGERGRVVGAVAGHRDEPAVGLLAADQLELGLGRGLGEEVVDARLLRDLGGGEPVVAGDHDGADAHRAQLLEALAHPVLDDVAQLDHAEDLRVAGDGERRRALAGDPVDRRLQLRRRLAALVGDPAQDRVAGALAQPRAVVVDAAHPRLGGEGHELGAVRGELVLAQPVLLGQHDDRAPLGRLVGERGQLRGLGQLGLGDAGHREERRRLAVAERDRAGLVEQQHVDVARGLDRAARQREHVAAHEPVHARDPDRRQQRADRGRDERDEQRDQDGDRDRAARELGERPQRDDDDEEDDRQAREQDAERDLVRRLAPRGALDEGDHAVDERLTGLLGDLDDDAVREHARAARDRAAVAAGLADDGRGLAGDGRLVDGGDALDHGAVAGDDLAGLDHHDVAAAQLRGGLGPAVAQLRDRLGAHRPQRVGLRLAAALRDRLGEVAEDDRQPQEERDREGEPPPGPRCRLSQISVVTHGADLDHEHDRVADHLARVELGQRRQHRGAEDVALQQRALGAIGHRLDSRSRARLSSSTLTEPSPARPSSGWLVCVVDEREHAGAVEPAALGDAVGLDARVGLRDVGIHARGRGGHGVGGDRARRAGPGWWAARGSR